MKEKEVGGGDLGSDEVSGPRPRHLGKWRRVDKWLGESIDSNKYTVSRFNLYLSGLSFMFLGSILLGHPDKCAHSDSE